MAQALRLRELFDRDLGDRGKHLEAHAEAEALKLVRLEVAGPHDLPEERRRKIAPSRSGTSTICPCRER